jgi:S-formylglutathione hydrolase FrmB
MVGPAAMSRPRDSRKGPAARRWLRAALLAIVSAALIVAGAAGALRYVETYWLYRGFAAPTMPHSIGKTRVLPTTVQEIVVTSPALGGYQDLCYVVLPPGYASHPARRYPVLYLLHGFTGKPTNFLTILDVQDAEAALVAEGTMKPLILVMPSGTRSFFSDTEWANGIGAGNGWETFVARDLVNAIDTRYRTISSGSGRGIAGLSEGGYGALNIGLHHPGEFALIESWSGYMRADDFPSIFGHSARLLGYNSPSVWVVSVAARLRADRTFIWFYCASSDFMSVGNRAFNAELTALGVAHRYFEPATGTHGHTFALWRDQLPQALITASDHLGHG